MSDAKLLIDRLKQQGVTISIEGGKLVLSGCRPADSDRELLIAHKSEILDELRFPGLDWDTMRRIGSRLGEMVVVDGRQCRLWGVTPRGPIIDTGSFVITVTVQDFG